MFSTQSVLICINCDLTLDKIYECYTERSENISNSHLSTPETSCSCDNVKKTNSQVKHESRFPSLCWRAMSAGCLFMAPVQQCYLYQRICMSIAYISPLQVMHTGHCLQPYTHFGTAL